MHEIVKIDLIQFLLVYIILLVVGLIMKYCRVNQTKLLFIASTRMTAQLVIAGFILTYILQKNNPWLTSIYIICMTAFAIYQVLSKNKTLNKKFKQIIALSITITSFSLLLIFVSGIIGENILNPQYTIPLAGMIIGNIMNGISVGIKTFRDSLKGQNIKIEALMFLGAHPRKILLPFVKQALSTAILPTINNMVGMGIVYLPGMLTGQILSGTLPMTAIMYQIAIMIIICAAIYLSCFSSLYVGYQTLFDNKQKIIQL